MNKKMMLAALLVNMVTAVFGTDFEERISSGIWIRDYFNEVIYRKDRNILVEFQPGLKKTYYYESPLGETIFWFEEEVRYRDRLKYYKFDDDEYDFYIMIGKEGFSYKAKEVAPDLYELEIENVRISQDDYENLLECGHDMRFALDATEPGYSLYFRFDGDYLYLYLEDGKTLYATYCAYDDAEKDALYEAIRTNEFDMTKFTFPRHADGTCEFETKEETGAKAVRIEGGWYLAAENLRLRKDADISSDIITTMQAGTLVEILSTGKEDTIDGITGDWVKIQVVTTSFDKDDNTIESGTEGWCFGGYLK